MVKETVVSAGSDDLVLSFSPNGSQGRYGLPVEKVAWVANRERPVNGSYGVLMINASDGNLVLVDDKNVPVCCTARLRKVALPLARFSPWTQNESSLQSPVLELAQFCALVAKAASQDIEAD
ncbi:hypothetical protein HAX54_048980 [Datura stramonium]|uniref:Bulb-type lectin domain-containing protein n=1 Tax=Datura stramonium TaxID=4076 RepID=A0ABS8WPQ2_DATST|nr:hypothetical protein [Datura stramonium]